MASLLTTPFTGEAWFFATAQAQQENAHLSPEVSSSQNLPLLASSVGMVSDLKPDDGVTIDIVDGQAMVPEIGPSGTAVDMLSDIETAPTIVYIVQPGDNVAAVAKRFGISENTLRFANGMKKTDVLHRGDTLLILPVSGIRYTVKSGDTLNSIAKKYKLGTEEFVDMLDYNNLEASSPLTIGDQLILPGVELSEAVTTPSKSPSKKTTSATPATTKTTTNVTRGYFIKPIPCPLSQGKHDTYAIDMACGRSGIPIKAAASGKVIRAQYGWNGGYGNLVVIQHPNGMITFYAHIQPSGIKVQLGDQVNQGDIIGLVGTTGRSTGPHLHFEVRNGINPGFDKTGSAWKQ